MALFRKIGSNLAPMFRKLPGEVSSFGRKVVNTSDKISRGISTAQKAVDKLDAVAPNPILKTVKSGLSAAQDLSNVGIMGGKALRAASEGHLAEAADLGRAALSEAGEGVGKLAGAGASLAAFV